MTSQRILITGGTGFIGKNLVEGLAHSYTISHPTSAELNLLDAAMVKRYLLKNRFDVVIHAATHNATVTSPKDRSKVFYSNMMMFYSLARMSKLYGKMFYMGSGAEYDQEKLPENVTEEFLDTFVPPKEYGFSKYIMAQYAQKSENIIDLCLFGCFGKYEDWRIRFISNAICHTLFHLPIRIDQDQTIDYLDCSDFVSIVDAFLQKKKLNYHRYNICSGTPRTLLSIAKIIQNVSGNKKKIRIIQKEFGRIYSADNSRFRGEFPDVKPSDFTTSINDLYEWYKKEKNEIDQKQLGD